MLISSILGRTPTRFQKPMRVIRNAIHPRTPRCSTRRSATNEAQIITTKSRRHLLTRASRRWPSASRRRPSTPPTCTFKTCRRRRHRHPRRCPSTTRSRPAARLSILLRARPSTRRRRSTRPTTSTARQHRTIILMTTHLMATRRTVTRIDRSAGRPTNQLLSSTSKRPQTRETSCIHVRNASLCCIRSLLTDQSSQKSTEIPRRGSRTSWRLSEM